MIKFTFSRLPLLATCISGLFVAGCDPCQTDADCHGTFDDVPRFSCEAEVCEDGFCVLATTCTDGLVCNPDLDTCTECSAELPCAEGTCNPQTGACEVGPKCVDCDDGIFCNGEEFCEGDVCVPGEDPCPNLTCDEARKLCCIPEGQDGWTTSCTNTMISFCENEIPAEFFGNGSDAFNGYVFLRGANPNECDTFMTRLEPACFPPQPKVDEPEPASATVPIELTTLNLVSCQPIIVSFQGGEIMQEWDVVVGLSEISAPTGQMTITKTSAGGGTFGGEFFVQPVFTFINVADPTLSVDLDSGAEGTPPDRLILQAGTPFMHQLDFQPTVTRCAVASGFAPGVDESADPNSTSGSSQCCKEICHPGATATHCVVIGVECKGCPDGACCDASDGSCRVFEADEANQITAVDKCADFGGVYKGDNQTCVDSDGDGFPDVYEEGDCCKPIADTLCTTRTDPTDPDTDGDGVSDWQEIAELGTDACDETDPEISSLCDGTLGGDCDTPCGGDEFCAPASAMADPSGSIISVTDCTCVAKDTCRHVKFTLKDGTVSHGCVPFPDCEATGGECTIISTNGVVTCECR